MRRGHENICITFRKIEKRGENEHENPDDVSCGRYLFEGHSAC
jgi:hypothetical protein